MINCSGVIYLPKEKQQFFDHVVIWKMKVYMFPAFFKWLDWNTEKEINFVQATFYASVSQDPVFGFKDIRSEKAPSNKTPVLTKSMNMDTLVVCRSKVGGNLKLKGGPGTSYDTMLERYAVILQRYIRYFFSFGSTLL